MCITVRYTIIVEQTINDFFSSLSASHTSEDKDESTGESGYSDVESSISGLSEAASYSPAEISERQTSVEINHRKPKEGATKELKRKKSKEAVSGTYKEPGGMSQMETIVPGKKIISKTRTKQVGKKGMYIRLFSCKTAGSFLALFHKDISQNIIL